ncbi:MAG: phosphoglycerol transferase [Marinobacter excellens HL-55]|uniref:Phosphoglycerol transferase n=1 Tax=Marinobacter excellens HL-55 TaxID=1305731 RepID=A0A0P8BPK8_9GAMM|nr:MAG: phosphoglycerol transferase [Marinobacter excellens HL-55]
MEKNRAFSLACFTQTFFLALVWLLIARGLLIAQSGVVPSLQGTLGGDIAGAFILAVLLQLSGGILRGILITLLGCALYVAGMHLGTHGTLFKLAFASKGMDTTFITGSLLNLYLLTLPGYLVLAWLLHRLHRQWIPVSNRQPALLLAGTVLVIITYSLSFPSLTTPANNVVASTLAQIPGAILNPVGTAIGDETAEISEPLKSRTNFFHQEVGNQAHTSRPNVLLILIEGLSGGYLPSVSEYHNLTPAVSLDTLEATFDEFGFRIYKNMLSMERQTDRGTYTLVCGRYPDLRRPSEKLQSVASSSVTPDCLPEKLRDQGYNTAYWQAAPIEYMNKDAFMSQAGYDDVTGANTFIEGEESDGWGPPDPEFFNNIAQRLRQMDEQEAPWFVTSLNVGTHHPFKIGEQAEQELASEQLASDADTLTLPQAQTPRRNAMRVMAQSLDRLLADLEQAGVLDNTLVIVSSDESGGFIRDDHESLPLNSNLGVLAIRPPSKAYLDQLAPDNRIVTQLDIPITILDVTGHGDKAGRMIGRSLLTTDIAKSRDIMLADTYTGMKYFLRETGTLLACTELMTRCSTWSFDPERLFGSLQEVEGDPFLTIEERFALTESATLQTPQDP